MKQHSLLSLPHPQQILACANNPGVLLNTLQSPTGCFTTLVCFKAGGFKAGTSLELPDAWWRFAKESSHSANIVQSKVITDIACGAEIVVCGTPEDRKPDPEEPAMSDDVASGADSVKDAGFSCQRCGKVFSYEYYRDKHLKYTRCVDNGNRKFPCTICSRSFEKRDRLRIHILHVHENHRPHTCSVCQKAFSQSSSLNKHLRVHSGERPYKCSFCPKAFTASSILRTHVRQHSGEKPFKCAHCGKAFASHAAHDSHVRRSHMSQS
ncbi:unnamed protein product [Caenorhabditis sp. 36 PRJEB53466]|nr:unnamed protein product [Caenorhabditis sp. 36 PRJEB53466]